jgi:FtsP/CotA-like multicopper oxidase with cupredoxin domain
MYRSATSGSSWRGVKKSLVLVAAFALLPAIGFQQSALAAGNNGAGANAGKASSGADAAATSTKASRVTAAAPTDATDPTKVPHYFGPYPNWANSPFTQSTAAVTFVDPGGSGVGAEAVAQIDPTTGGIKTIDVTVPGHDYSQATTVDIAGGTGATATPSITASGAVVSLKVSASGSAYESFAVTLTGGGGTGAAVSAVGGVDAVTISNGGTGYTMPTVDFDLPGDPSGTQAAGHVPMIANGDTVNGMTSAGVITQVVVDSAGTGYTVAPGVAIHDGTLADPILGATLATATSTLKLTGLTVDSIGSGYTSSPTVDVTDPTGSGTGATATAVTDTGAMSAVTVTTAGSGFLTAGLKKFQDELPITCDPKVDGTGCPLAAATPGMGPANKYIPLGVPEVKTYAGKEADQYVIGLVQYRTKFSSDLPATLARGYVQISTAAVPGQHVQLTNELMDGTKVDIPGYFGVTAPQWLGPIVSATKDRPVRVVFRNLLPTGAGGDLFLPTDTSMMGAGTGPVAKADPTNGSSVLDGVRNPACTDAAKGTSGCFTDNRATLHLHGGTTPWISDGTPHQWVTPAGENTDWPEGVSVQNVPDMTTDGTATGPAVCAAKDDGCSTFFYSNQQSARMMWYHDHSWGITRLNVYAGEVGGYLLTDDTEKALISTNTIPGAVDTLPLIVQDRTFTPDAVQLAAQDPTWDSNKWGTKGSFWYHHVYMPAQNPGDPSGMSSYGRWMYGPWFWPPASDIKYGPIANPYYDPTCNLDVPSTWTYQVGPFCEPEQIPGTPNISTGMEQFNDTPLVNGVAYPKLTLDPKTYRMRLLNGANDRFFNFQWYTADPLQGAGDSEVALKPNELLAAQTDPVVSPTPVDANNSAAGPDWIEIGTEGGFLPAPAVVDGQQPTTYITDGTRFDVGNVDKHSMLLAPAERADVLVDFSRFAGKTLILYNDAPAAFPARVASYDYYTGAPDMSPIGAPSVLPGFGPNTRTIMQVKIADTAPATAFNLTKLRTAFQHHADGSGVFESSQHPIIVGQAAYNSAYGTSFAGSSNCNSGTLTKCDGLARVNDTATFGFNTLKGPNAKMTAKVEPKAIHDEMNSTTFDEYGRMQATLGIEAQPPTPGGQNVTLYPYVNPATEIIDATNLPSADTKVTAISSAADGSQIWRITHNGVDTHPIHFHLFDVQLINRVTWDNIIIPTEPSELGWKETVRVSPLEDTIVALRPVIPKVPFEVPNSVRPLNPMMPLGSTAMFNNVLPDGTPSSSITNQLVNFGWEYVYHCHILSHEEMDMMRPISVAIPPLKADGLVRTVANKRNQITFNDNSITETSFALERTSNGTTWATVGTLASPLSAPNTHGSRMIVDSSGSTSASYLYRVVALNAVGYQTEFPSTTVKSTSGTVAVNVTPTLAPTALTASVLAGPQVSLTWKDNASNETGFVVERSANGGATYTQVATPAAKAGSGSSVTLTDATVALGTTYLYRVAGTGLGGTSAFSNVVTILVAVPAIPTQLLGTAARQGSSERITTSWADVNNETSYRVQWSTSSTFATIGGTGTTAANVITLTTPNLARTIWFVRVQAVNPLGSSAFSTPVQVAAAL